MAGCVLEMEGVWKRYSYGRGWVLRDVSLCIPPGSGVLVLGPNGSGKTTLLRIAAGLAKPSRGVVRVAGLPPQSVEAKHVMGVVLHHSILYDELTVRENLSYYARLHGLDGYSPEGDEVVEALGLRRYLDTRVGELSFGWRKRANIARALLHRPQLLAIDEPFTGLDDAAVEALAGLLEELTRRGAAVLATSPQRGAARLLPGFRVMEIHDSTLRPAGPGGEA
ncbi:MAG: ABC transporter ATP-binding protein [Crenarchaeota archaeon]|nr:ABC transporter ATP-binding protein [Thermoproteota archaeon]